MTRTKPRDNTKYANRRDALRRHAQQNNIPCWLCNKPINWQAHWKDKDSFTADSETVEGDHAD